MNRNVHITAYTVTRESQLQYNITRNTETIALCALTRVRERLALHSNLFECIHCGNSESNMIRLYRLAAAVVVHRCCWRWNGIASRYQHMAANHSNAEDYYRIFDPDFRVIYFFSRTDSISCRMMAMKWENCRQWVLNAEQILNWNESNSSGFGSGSVRICTISTMRRALNKNGKKQQPELCKP